MGLQVLANGCSVYEITGKKDDGGNIVVHHSFVRGDVLPDWVDESQRFVLVSSGMVAEVGDTPDGSVRPFDLEPHPVVGDVANVTVADKAASDGDLEPLPADNDTKFVWETYAATKLPDGERMTRQEAESMKKTDLVAEVKARYEAANDDDALAAPVLPPKF
jgi:hypothetical protein